MYVYIYIYVRETMNLSQASIIILSSVATLEFYHLWNLHKEPPTLLRIQHQLLK